MKASIISFEPKYAKDFANLNIEWLEKYFVVEPHDVDILERCEEMIINKGGYIFFAKINEEIVGTFALIKIKDGVYELGKMGVSPRFQGKKIGQQLIQFCIEFATSKKWEKLLLYSNHILENAIYIYTKYGFKEIPIEDTPLYKRSTIKMELVLPKK
ncbi:GNAT family N-acetyltransferase [Aquimarina longa]|uniref:GNAT family N-acetyltransferase n=1 Tax=Aquimarina longa TaxID=1080221 RepID=UPI000784E1D0|nr:GNAT family N-acetyltransferase [Aquimarina longa]